MKEKGITYNELNNLCWEGDNLQQGFSDIGNGGLIDITNHVEELGHPFEELRTMQEEGIGETFYQCIGLGVTKQLPDLYNTVELFSNTQVNPDEPSFYYTTDHLGSSSYLTNDLGQTTQIIAYMPYGEDWVNRNFTQNFRSNYKYNGKEKDPETGYNYFGARYYTDWASIWLSVDPLSDKYPHLTSYNYCANNPIMLIDPDGREPAKSKAGTIAGFVKFFNNTKTKMGTLRGNDAHNAMLRLGKTEWSWSQMRPVPSTTNPINRSSDKYIYTKEGGWIDMSHFLFYAGKAYKYKQDGEKYPMGKALKEGLKQEMSDLIIAPHSAFSYEDLPSDKLGADFGANHFDPNSKKTFGEQLQDYMINYLKATMPDEAPNYDKMPKNESREKPTRTNPSSTPIYTEQNP